MDYVHARTEARVESQFPNIETILDLRHSFTFYAGTAASDPVIRKFEFFLRYQREWSEKLLAESHRKSGALRYSPLEKCKEPLHIPAPSAFWCGLRKLFFRAELFSGRIAADAGRRCGYSENKIKLEQTIRDEFNLMMSGVLKERHGDE